MRMEELSDSRYIKSTDTVERYLLNLVQEYFKNSNIASTTSREYIINKAVERMKEELSFDSIGVLSITLPDGEKRTGAVTITLEDLNGEPLITPKLSAFNVPFGNEQNTACEGNDPRLSDARKPLEHQHEISDVIGLEGQLSTLEGMIKRLGQFDHEHPNKKVLDMLVYTGDKTIIDLGELEGLEDKILALIETIMQEIDVHKQEIANKVLEVNNKITETNQKIEELKQFILDKNNEYLQQSKDYTDTKITDAENEINTKIADLIKKEDLNDVVDIANKAYTLVARLEYKVRDAATNTGHILGPDVLNEITARGTTLDACMIDINLKFMNAGKTFKYNLPYLVFKDGTVSGVIQAEVQDDGDVLFHVDAKAEDIPPYIYDGEIVISVYSRSQIIF